MSNAAVVNPEAISHIAFKDKDSAEFFRKQTGGWIFEANNGTWICFINMTPSQILVHPATKGLSGRLI
jgi:hypothetical protein